jgi:putative heme-binding domain-containing protein
MFAKNCQQCHTLFALGAKIGPDLTGSNRANVDYVLSNIVDPSAVIGKDYQAHIINTKGGRVLTGLIRNEDDTALTLVTATETIVIPIDEVDERIISPKSMMPDDVVKQLNERELRSLVAYLASPQQTQFVATADTLKYFFNGKDLTGWRGEPSLWTVENGEIVGQTTGLNRNEFLRSELVASDYHFSCDVLLVKNEGNSGIQFRSTELPDGEVKGYQADIGAGWWGKLYEEHGRALLWDQSGETHIKPGEWTHYEIDAVGSHIRTWLNGKQCVDLEDAPGAKSGIFALQLHSGGATQVRFKNLELRLIK